MLGSGGSEILGPSLSEMPSDLISEFFWRRASAKEGFEFTAWAHHVGYGGMIHQIIIGILASRISFLCKNAEGPLDIRDLFRSAGQTDDAVIKML